MISACWRAALPECGHNKKENAGHQQRARYAKNIDCRADYGGVRRNALFFFPFVHRNPPQAKKRRRNGRRDKDLVSILRSSVVWRQNNNPHNVVDDQFMP
jgi:hypothetical protein